jgi:hypothetical protein
MSLFTCCVAIGACHHATIDLGATPSLETIHEPWANSWIYSLVPPSRIETAAKCASGVAKVETQRSFLNGLVAILTLGIYTPMEIKVTCAARGNADSPEKAELSIEDGASLQEIQTAFMTAADRAVEENRAVFVQF